MLDPSGQKSRIVWKEFGQGLKLEFVQCPNPVWLRACNDLGLRFPREGALLRVDTNSIEMLSLMVP
jgi:hypothetical protein